MPEMSYEEHVQKQNERDRYEMFAKQCGNFVNGSSDEIMRGAAKIIVAREHPTLQQKFMKFCIMYIEEMAANKRTDLRNESACEFSRCVLRDVEDNKRIMPMI